MNNTKHYTVREEKANAITHLLAAAVVVVAIFPIGQKLCLWNDPWAWAGYFLMFFGLLTSYIASTLYHSATEEVRKARLRKFDHAAIYLNIAGNYSPFALFLLRNEGFWGWALFLVVWISALVGIVLNFGKMKRNNHIKSASYLMMGWVVVIALKPMYDVLGRLDRVEALWWLLAEGVLYTIGALFYMFARREFMHAVFHLFVLAATVCHLIAAYLLL